MSVETKNVFIGAPDQAVTGAILTGPETDVIPDWIDDFALTGLKDSGYVDENGVEIAISESTTGIKDWSRKIVRKILDEFDGTISWAHLEMSEGALKNYMGDENVEVQAATVSKGKQTRAAIAGEMRPTKAWYFKIKDGERRGLVFVPHGQVTERGAISLLANDAIKLPVTLTTYPDKFGKSIYLYFDDGAPVAA